MLSGDIRNHIEFIFSEVLRFYLSQLISAKGVSLYTSKEDEFNEVLKKSIEDIKRTMNIVMDDVLEQYEEQYLEKRKILKNFNFNDLNQNQ